MNSVRHAVRRIANAGAVSARIAQAVPRTSCRPILFQMRHLSGTDKPLDNIIVDSSKNGTSKLDVEKELYEMKRTLTNHFTSGEYEQALAAAIELSRRIEQVYGRKNAVYASSLNNVALMNKMMGKYEEAMKNYVDSLHVFEDVDGKRSASYASTLANVGALYILQAGQSSGFAQVQLQQRADEALTDSLALRREILGVDHKDTLTTEIHMSTLLRVQGKLQEAVDLLNKLRATALEKFGTQDLMLATVENNLGLVYKEAGDFASARDAYTHALSVRTALLGDAHPDCIVTLHNLAECFMAMDQKDEADQIQRRILELLGHTIEDGPEEEGDEESDTEEEEVVVEKVKRPSMPVRPQPVDDTPPMLKRRTVSPFATQTPLTPYSPNRAPIAHPQPTGPPPALSSRPPRHRRRPPQTEEEMAIEGAKADGAGVRTGDAAAGVPDIFPAKTPKVDTLHEQYKQVTRKKPPKN